MDFETVAEVYRQTNSTKQTAKLLSISEVKVRRILITCGLWNSQTSDQIGELYQQGLSVSIETTETTERGIIMDTNINVLKLHLELFLDHPDPREMGILKKYAKVEKGMHIR